MKFKMENNKLVLENESEKYVVSDEFEKVAEILTDPSVIIKESEVFDAGEDFGEEEDLVDFIKTFISYKNNFNIQNIENEIEALLL